jgi:hypothetical protein
LLQLSTPVHYRPSEGHKRRLGCCYPLRAPLLDSTRTDAIKYVAVRFGLSFGKLAEKCLLPAMLSQNECCEWGGSVRSHLGALMKMR